MRSWLLLAAFREAAAREFASLHRRTDRLMIDRWVKWMDGWMEGGREGGRDGWMDGV